MVIIFLLYTKNNFPYCNKQQKLARQRERAGWHCKVWLNSAYKRRLVCRRVIVWFWKSPPRVRYSTDSGVGQIYTKYNPDWAPSLATLGSRGQNLLPRRNYPSIPPTPLSWKKLSPPHQRAPRYRPPLSAEAIHSNTPGLFSLRHPLAKCRTEQSRAPYDELLLLNGIKRKFRKKNT